VRVVVVVVFAVPLVIVIVQSLVELLLRVA
jgi:hypothetical protein